jgi:hypothetical protein
MESKGGGNGYEPFGSCFYHLPGLTAAVNSQSGDDIFHACTSGKNKQNFRTL